jgi:hypothetical protein
MRQWGQVATVPTCGMGGSESKCEKSCQEGKKADSGSSG